MPSRRDFLSAALAAQVRLRKVPDPVIQIRGEKFHFNDLPTYAGRTWNGHSLEGLLLNSRMVQGIYDDENPQTLARWAYPDTGKWDPNRNTQEFLDNMSAWRKHGLRGITLNLQGGSPQGYSKEQPWRNSAIAPDGSLKPAYMKRLQLILDKAKLWHMGVILGIFYFGQDEYLANDDAVRKAVRETLLFLQNGRHWHVMVEIANECDGKGYQQPLIQAPRIHELIALAKSITTGGQRNYVSASFNGGTIPHANVVKESDFLLLHGNGVSDPRRITQMVEQTRQVSGYRPMPILFNEDDHFDFDKPENNFAAAIAAGASWGYFDPGESNYKDGYQCPPVNWGINTERKKAFFHLVAEMTGSRV
ncbi:hypothetical protein [Paludibaculum fermentans]|uniref:hypothetical protein n=1 Tax=Paludibaculum fermentans TaxID=1473598 RepID=UPI003EB96E6C